MMKFVDKYARPPKLMMAHTTLGEVRSMLEQDPDIPPSAVQFIMDTARADDSAEVVIMIDGAVVTYGIVKEKKERIDA